jgi:hypothetical protein
MEEQVKKTAKKTTMKRHMSLCLAGALKWRKNLKGIFTDENGNEVSHMEAKKYIKECIEKGWRVIPMSEEPCEGFSYQDGCPGHVVSVTYEPEIETKLK